MGEFVRLQDMRRRVAELVRRRRWRMGREIATVFVVPTDATWAAEHANRFRSGRSAT